MRFHKRSVIALALLLPLSLCLVGCGGGGAKPAAEPAKQGTGQPSAAAHDDHSGWWCAAHGVPEDVCTRCQVKLIAGFKEKGDWCEEHSRPDSQCFHHHPELEEQFAARYEAKYGTKPPKITDP